MSIGDFAGGFTKSISNYLTQERDRQRKSEDERLKYQMDLIELLRSDPRATPALMGKAIHDLLELSDAKVGKRKQKAGTEGFLGHSELPVSQLLQGLADGSMPLYGAPIPQTPKPVQTQRAPVPSVGVETSVQGFPEFGDPFNAEVQQDKPAITPPGYDMPEFTGESVLKAQVPIPPKGTFVPKTAEGMASAAQQYEEGLWYRPEQMGELKGKAQAAEFNQTFKNKMDLASQYLEPDDVDLAAKAAFGISTANTMLLGTKPEVYVAPDGTKFMGQPLKQGGIYNHGTGQPVAGAMLENEANNRLSSLYQLAAAHLGLPMNSSDWTPQQADMMRQYLLSYDGQRLSQQYGLSTQFAIARAWNSPRIIQGTDPVTGQAGQAFMTPAQGAGGGVGVPRISPVPMPAPGAALQPNLSNPPQPAIAPPPVNPTPGRPNMQQGNTATPNPQRPVVKPTAAQTPPAPGTVGGLQRSQGGLILSPPTADMRNQAVNLEPIIVAMDQIGQMAREMNTARQGLGGYVRGRIQSGKGRVGMDNAAAVYDRTRKGFLATFSRVAGERGVLNEGDIQRAEALLPKIGDPEQVTEELLTQLGMFMQEKFGVLPEPVKRQGTADTTTGGSKTMKVGKYTVTVGP